LAGHGEPGTNCSRKTLLSATTGSLAGSLGRGDFIGHAHDLHCPSLLRCPAPFQSMFKKSRKKPDKAKPVAAAFPYVSCAAPGFEEAPAFPTQITLNLSRNPRIP
jgi:hypothetical protein